MTVSIGGWPITAIPGQAVGGAPAGGLDGLAVLAAISLALLLVAILSASAALLYRKRAVARRERFERLAAHWNPEIVAFLFDDRSVEDIQRLVARADRLLFVNALLQFSRRLSGEELIRIGALAAPFLPVVSSRLGRRSAGVRARAVQTLGELGLDAHIPQIVAALDDPSPLVSIVAARALCNPQSVDHLPEVLARLGRFRSWTPTFLASMLASAESLGAHALREALWDDSLDDWSRAIAAEALSDLNDFRATGAAAHVLERGGDRILVVAALRLIGQVGRAGDLTSIIDKIEDPDFVIRVAAVDALAALGGQAELERLQSLLYHDPSRWVALHAARGLMRAGWSPSLRTLARGDHERAAIGAQVLAEAGRR